MAATSHQNETALPFRLVVQLSASRFDIETISRRLLDYLLPSVRFTFYIIKLSVAEAQFNLIFKRQKLRIIRRF